MCISIAHIKMCVCSAHTHRNFAPGSEPREYLNGLPVSMVWEGCPLLQTTLCEGVGLHLWV